MIVIPSHFKLAVRITQVYKEVSGYPYVSGRGEISMTLAIPAFDIFSGRYGEKGIVWLGAVARLEDARTRMLNLAEKQPGAYFVFNSDTKALEASIDTSPPLRASESEKRKGAA